MSQVTYLDVKESKEIQTYIRMADQSLSALGFTEHAFPHVTKCANTAYHLLLDLGYPARTAELARIAGYTHDIGNVINRIDHAQSGAVMAFRILDKMGMDASEVATVISAIGNHDEGTAVPVNPVAAALILADKSDVRRSRVRNKKVSSFDIHDRVNYSVQESQLVLSKEKHTVTLYLTIDTEICAVMEYFEIFMERMLLCRKAADFLKLHFGLVVNGPALL